MRRILHIRQKWEPLTPAEAFANLTDVDQKAVEDAARTGNWVGRYCADGFSPENIIWESIQAAFIGWCEHPDSQIPHQVRDIFSRMEKLVKPNRSRAARTLQPDGAN